LKIRYAQGRTDEISIDVTTIEQVLLQLEINPVEVIVSKNGHLVPEDAMVSNDDEIRIFRIVHGG